MHCSNCIRSARALSAQLPPLRPLQRWSSSLSAQYVFSERAKLAQRTRAARAPAFGEYEYLRDEVAGRLVGRLADISRVFPTALDLGANAGSVLKQLLAQRTPEGGVLGGVAELHQLEPCAAMLDAGAVHQVAAAAAGLQVRPRVAPMDGAALPYGDASLDLVLSSMALHWVNDVPGLLAEVRRVLKPDGVFIAAFLGGDTLMELRWV